MNVRPKIRIRPLTIALSIAIGCGEEPVGPPDTGSTSDTSATMSSGSGGTGAITEDTGATTTSSSGGSGATTSSSSEGTGVTTSSSSGGGSSTDDSGSGTGPDTDTGCVPEDEICNGLDDDCNGQIDDGDPGGGQACDTGTPGACAEGISACEAGELVCTPTVAPAAEACNGLDDDCNGQIDDGNPGGGQACDTGMPGACAAGHEQCSGGALTCVADDVPAFEVCNGVDDDCNDQIDDGNPGGWGACDTGLWGVCEAGTLACMGGGLVCLQNQPPSPNEPCAGNVDSNCNGQVDEGCFGACPYSLCTFVPMPLDSTCDPCVTQICAVSPFCCAGPFVPACVGLVETVCDRADCIAPGCAHPVCITGEALAAGCHPCVDQICAANPSCCGTSWDAVCVDAVASICGLDCP